jgi:hypothetical protein
MDPPFGIIDDSDPSIRYVGAWKQGGSAQEYLSTTHGASQAGLHAVLTFSGKLPPLTGRIQKQTYILFQALMLPYTGLLVQNDAKLLHPMLSTIQRL